ncbi:uncharacterized protein EI97DRAFT_435141, partial [Westerdykella ornata]
MAPAYLTGDKAAIEEFISRFDVSSPRTAPHQTPLTVTYRSFSLTAMVRGPPL